MRFDHLERRLDRLANSQLRHLARVDVSQHNAGNAPPTFERLVSQAVSAAQFSDPSFERLVRVIYPSAIVLPWGGTPHGGLHRKAWEYVYVLRAAEQLDVLQPGRRALGFGVGQEPIPAVLARYGLDVVATDLAAEAAGDDWTTTGQHLRELASLSQPDVVSDEVLARHVTVRQADMNDIPADLGRFDLVWSSCALEHLGSPDAGMQFVIRTLDHLEPGGVSVHTTELELTRRATTADYGNIVVYRTADLDALVADVRARGFEMEANWHVSMETPADRWIAEHPYDDPSHLKLTIGDSISTSVGLLIRRPR